VVAGVDEIALGLVVDAYGRTQLSTPVTISLNRDAITSRHGLLIRASGSTETTDVTYMLPRLSADAPAQTLERELPRIEVRYDRPTAAIVALVMEYQWLPNAAHEPAP